MSLSRKTDRVRIKISSNSKNNMSTLSTSLRKNMSKSELNMKRDYSRLLQAWRISRSSSKSMRSNCSPKSKKSETVTP